MPSQSRASIRAKERLETIGTLNGIGAEVVRVAGRSAEAAASALEGRPQIEFAELDLLRYPTDYPDEPYFADLWGIHNEGQVIEGYPGATDMDVNGPEASAVTLGDPGLVVAVIDEGVDFSHPDLADRAWFNSGESGEGKETNGLDDDGNGYVDDIHGWDFCHNDNTVHDVGEDDHGTHVSGTIAASLNGQGVVGVAPNVQIMSLKILDDPFAGPSCGLLSQELEAIDYAQSFGVRIANASFGGLGGSWAEESAIEDSGLLLVAAAGNAGVDNDDPSSASYPASYDLANIVSVAAIWNDGLMSWFSNYGSSSVDVSAPGGDILSTVPISSEFPSGFAWSSGTSMAAPHVTGVAALIGSVRPGLLAEPAQLKKVILDTGKAVPDTLGLTLTGGMPDARAAVDTIAPVSTRPVARLSAGAVLGTTTVPVPISWSAADDVSGVARHQLQKRVNDGSWATVTLTSPVATQTIVSLTPGARYAFRARAIDRAGNIGAWATGSAFRLSAYQENAGAIAYTGSWIRSSAASAYGGYLKSASTAGSRASLTFTGRRIAWVSPRGSSMGRAVVRVDGQVVATIDLQASTSQPRRIVYSRGWSSIDTHTIEVRVSGTPGHPKVSVDAFVVMR